MLPTMVGFVRLLIMKNARSFATNRGETCMINVLRGYARSYATNHGGLCMATDNGTHVVMLPTMVGFVRLLIIREKGNRALSYFRFYFPP